MKSLKSIVRNAIESWRCQYSKDAITQKIARQYHKQELSLEVDSNATLLKPVGADDKNNWQNFFRWNENTTTEAKANILDLLPAIIAAMPKDDACKMLNRFLGEHGFSVSVIGASEANLGRDQLLENHNKETGEAFRAVIALRENASEEQVREAYKEVLEAQESHKPILEFLETLMQKK